MQSHHAFVQFETRLLSQDCALQDEPSDSSTRRSTSEDEHHGRDIPTLEQNFYPVRYTVFAEKERYS